jgi:hypothetical protein
LDRSPVFATCDQAATQHSEWLLRICSASPVRTQTSQALPSGSLNQTLSALA